MQINMLTESIQCRPFSILIKIYAKKKKEKKRRHKKLYVTFNVRNCFYQSLWDSLDNENGHRGYDNVTSEDITSDVQTDGHVFGGLQVNLKEACTQTISLCYNEIPFREKASRIMLPFK